MILRNYPKTRVGFVAMALALSGCAAHESSPGTGAASPGPGDASVPEMQRIRGEVLVGKDGYGLTPCGSDQQRILTLSQQAGAFLDEFMQPGDKLEFFMDAWGREKDGKLEIIAVERAHTEGPRCDASREGAQFVVSGTEPFWSLQLSPSGWLLQRPDHPPLQVAAVPTKIGAGYLWTSTSPKATVEITPAYCADAMADAASAWQAKISLDDLRLTGCAHRGELPLP